MSIGVDPLHLDDRSSVLKPPRRYNRPAAFFGRNQAGSPPRRRPGPWGVPAPKSGPVL